MCTCLCEHKVSMCISSFVLVACMHEACVHECVRACVCMRHDALCVCVVSEQVYGGLEKRGQPATLPHASFISAPQ